MSARVAVIGAGAWGIALAIQAARAGCSVTLWSRSPVSLRADRSMNRLPGAILPDSVAVTPELPKRADLVLLAVPMQHLRAVSLRLDLAGPIIVCCKGLERGSARLPLEVLGETLPAAPSGILSGPNFAGEIAAGQPAASVLASSDTGLARTLGACLSSENFRLYRSDDPIGVQIGGAAKNVIAIATGAAIGAGLGENARAALITRGVAEIGRLIAGLGGNPATASGLSGLGDLVLTCTGHSSRNYSLGLALGRGESLDEILSSRSTVAEGVETAPALAARAAKAGVTVPLIEAVSMLLTGAIDLAQAKKQLLSRPLGME